MVIDSDLLDEVCRVKHSGLEFHTYSHYSIQGNFIFVYYKFLGFDKDQSMKMISIGAVIHIFQGDYLQIHREQQLDKLI